MFVNRWAKGLYFNADAGAGAGGTGGTAQAFKWDGIGLSPEQMNVVTNHGWKDAGALVDSYNNAQKLIGLKGQSPDRVLVMPKDDAPATEWDPIFAKLGVPAKAEEYQLPVPEGQPKEFAGAAASWMKEANIPKGAAVKLTQKWNAHVAAEQQKAQDAAQLRDATQVKELQTEWGAGYEANTALVDRAATEFGMSGEQLAALKQVLGPKGAMKFLHGIGSKIGKEGTFIGDDSGGGNVHMAPEQAQAEYNRLMRDHDFLAIWNGSDPKARSEAREKMSRLAQLAQPGYTTVSAKG